MIGASAGGVYALKELVASIPGDFDVPIFIVQHLAAAVRSYLPEILSAAGPLKAIHPADNDPVAPGTIYIAPPDHHMLVEKDRIIVRKGPKENRFRPSIDALFRSAAYSYGPGAIGIVLTGLLNDGTSGMWSIKRLGGIGIIQEPEEALYPSMPTSVLEYVNVDFSVPISEMAGLLSRLVKEPVQDKPDLSSEEHTRMKREITIAAQENAFERGVMEMGPLTPLTCPECNGTLITIREGKLIRYRCHTGHAFTSDALLAEVTKSVEENIWKSIRSLEETVMLLEQIGKNYEENGQPEEAEEFYNKARVTRERARKLHDFVFQQEQYSEDLRSHKPEGA
ncbi:chemotaxis protein CheB [Nibrella saemangeumensis]|uniref:protein-glutamate methylesterase n=1 Tax=Nibrella saemangeumensis TaxID=1084526 RepID=A0ABP8MLG1_9BACT